MAPFTHPETIIIFRTVAAGHPVMVNSRGVVAIETLASGRQTVLGCTIVLDNGKEIDVDVSVPEAVSKLFPTWKV